MPAAEGALSSWGIHEVQHLSRQGASLLSEHVRRTDNKKGRTSMKTFDEVFENVDSAIADTARKLRKVALKEVPDVEETVVGGAKVQNVLYYSGDSTRIVCGIQPSGKRCLFYLHRVAPEDVPEYHLGGKGKHSKHLAFDGQDEVNNAVIKRVIGLSVKRLL